jgi:hypothetical protein
MKEATLDDLIQDIMDINIGRSPLIPYNLHEGLRRILSAFDTHDSAELFFRQYRSDRFHNEQ